MTNNKELALDKSTIDELVISLPEVAGDWEVVIRPETSHNKGRAVQFRGGDFYNHNEYLRPITLAELAAIVDVRSWQGEHGQSFSSYRPVHSNPHGGARPFEVYLPESEDPSQVQIVEGKRIIGYLDPSVHRGIEGVPDKPAFHIEEGNALDTSFEHARTLYLTDGNEQCYPYVTEVRHGGLAFKVHHDGINVRDWSADTSLHASDLTIPDEAREIIATHNNVPIESIERELYGHDTLGLPVGPNPRNPDVPNSDVFPLILYVDALYKEHGNDVIEYIARNGNLPSRSPME